MFNGCGQDEQYNGHVSQRGCRGSDPMGLPVASSASGRIFDFGCANNTYTDPVTGAVSLVETSGTVVLGPSRASVGTHGKGAVMRPMSWR